MKKKKQAEKKRNVKHFKFGLTFVVINIYIGRGSLICDSKSILFEAKIVI